MDREKKDCEKRRRHLDCEKKDCENFYRVENQLFFFDIFLGGTRIAKKEPALGLRKKGLRKISP